MRRGCGRNARFSACLNDAGGRRFRRGRGPVGQILGMAQTARYGLWPGRPCKGGQAVPAGPDSASRRGRDTRLSSAPSRPCRGLPRRGAKESGILGAVRSEQQAEETLRAE